MGALRLMGNASLDDKFLSIAFTPFILSVQKNISLLVKSKRDSCLYVFPKTKITIVRRLECRRSQGAYRQAL